MAGRLEKSTNLGEVWGVIGQRCTEYAAPPDQPDPPESIKPPNAEQSPCVWKPTITYTYNQKDVCVEGFGCIFDIPRWDVPGPGTWVVSVSLFNTLSGFYDDNCGGNTPPPPILPYRV